MPQYLLSLHTGEQTESHQSMTAEDMQEFMGRINALEADMRESGAFVFTGGLQGPDAATVVRSNDPESVITDGPFVESKEHIAGFYVINADDLDQAQVWAGKVVNAVNAPIEVRQFFDGRGA